MLKETKLYSILFLKCSKCYDGEFLEANPYNSSFVNKVKVNCPNYGLKYHIEPSFDTGAMCVSYGAGVAVATYILSLIFGFNLGPMEIF